jgi:glycosyltransferase involved in cell wall biosynthesis
MYPLMLQFSARIAIGRHTKRKSVIDALAHEIDSSLPTMDHAFVIPAYGQSPHLEACIRSILNQSVGEVSIIVSSSTPSAYLEQVAGRCQVSLSINPRRSDIATDWNFAMASSDAQFVTIAHQDDLYHPQYLEVMGNAIRAHPDNILTFSDYGEHTDEGTRSLNTNLKIKRWLCSRAFGRTDAIRSLSSKKRLLNLGNPICCPSVIINRKRAPLFSFSSALKSNLDWDAWVRIAELPGEFLYIRQALVSKRVHPASETSVTIASGIRRREDLQMFERFWSAPIAAMIAAVYSLGYLSNRVAS